MFEAWLKFKPHPFQVLLTRHFRENCREMSVELSSKAENDVSRRASSSEEEEAYHSASEDTATSTIAAAREGEGGGREGEEGGGSEEVCAEGLTRLCVEKEPVGEPVSEAKVELSEEEWKVCAMC